MQYKELSIENLSIRYAKFSYDFEADGCCLTPKSFPLRGREMPLIAACSKYGLKVFRCRSKRRLATIYRITDGSSFVDFVLREDGVKVQKISAASDEGFVINKFAKVVFEFGAKWIVGMARYKHGLAVYSNLGFTTDAESKTFLLMAPAKLPE
jgi:hypothetical protein